MLQMANTQTQITNKLIYKKKRGLSSIPGIQWLLFIIPAVYMLLLTFIPILKIMKLGVHNGEAYTFEYLLKILTTPVYLKVILYTFKISVIATVVTLLLGYPVAYLLYKMKSDKWRNFTTALIMIPFWISALIRTFTWMIMLQNEGLINKFLMGLGLINEPLQLLYNSFGNAVGMIHYLFPYMVFCIYSVMKGIDGRLIQAAEGMGARPLKAFRDIVFPLSMPGVVAGVLICFVFSLGFFITGVILGGPKDAMIANLIANFINVTLNWNLAAALSIILLVATILLILVPFIIFRKHPALKGVI